LPTSAGKSGWRYSMMLSSILRNDSLRHGRNGRMLSGGSHARTRSPLQDHGNGSPDFHARRLCGSSIRLNTVCHLARSSPTSRPRTRAISLSSNSLSGAGSITTRAMALKLCDGAMGGRPTVYHRCR
jgi:hypothetical protein